jgi:hypothetical protein
VGAATGLLLWSLTMRQASGGDPRSSTAGPGVALNRFTAIVTPPEYLERQPESFENPDEVTIVAGSTLRIEVAAATPLAWLEDPSRGSRPLIRDGDGPFVIEWVPDVSGAVALAAGVTTGIAEHSRLLLVTVVPDSAPRVRVEQPGRDLAFTTPNHTVEVAIAAEDTEGLRNLELRYTRLSGSGESFEFAEGRVPIEITRSGAGRWTARARWSLAGIGLDDGDSLVYRAMVRDSNPDADWVPSESFTIDVGNRLEFAGAGFAVPDEDRRYAISQQMVIMKTERLQAERGKLTGEDWAEQTRFLAIEQRMVRSEVVFLSGGEVQDEVEEAAHSHELQEGRLENAGRAEMLRAINEMSRAEARLNAGDTAEALVFERAALKALQRAFDRRRYFLRTLPERARIDASRRLSGDREDAQSFVRPSSGEEPDAVETERALMRDLVSQTGTGQAPPPALLARLAQVDATDPEWRRAVTALAAASSADDVRTATATMMNLVAARARARLAPAATGGESDRAQELRGWWADELRLRRPQ